MPAISVIIPTKNRLQLLQETLQSLSVQTLSDWECLVVDDGSSDGTGQFVSEQSRGDSRIKYLQRQGDLAGANVCRNQGLGASTGQFVIFLDSDDVLGPTCLEVRSRDLQSHTALDFIVYQAGTFKEQVGDCDKLWHPFTPGDDLSRFLQHECVWDITGPIWRRSVFDRYGAFDQSLRSMQDYDLHIRILANQLPYAKLRIVDHYIRGHSVDNKTSDLHFRSPDYIRGVEMLPHRFMQLLEQNNLMTWSRLRLIQGLAFSMAENWVHINQPREATRAWKSQRVLSMPGHVYFGGLWALKLLHLSKRPTSFARRVVNKWKGQVRFRQEPLIMKYNVA